MKLGMEGQHAIVTGGTRGLGKAMVEALLKEGVNVSYCARTVTGNEFNEFLSTTAAEPGVSKLGRVSGTVLDLGNTSDIKPWVDKAVEEFGGLNIVISNASPMLPTNSVEDWTGTFYADILAVVVLIQATEEYLAATRGNILINGSCAQRESVVFPGSGGKESPYAPVKAALAQHANNMAKVLGPKGIRVNTIAPGLIMFPGANWDKALQYLPHEVKPFIDRVALDKPKGRWGTPEEVADAALYLVSPRASYVSGASLLVTGAFHIATAF